MQALKIIWVRSVLHSFNLFRIHPDADLTHKMTQVLEFQGSKRTFRLFEEKLVLREWMENSIQMIKMGCLGFSMDEDIIKEN